MKPGPVETCVETYLRRATRGLWGKKRLEVREELAAHLQERVLTHQISGLDENGALERALSELGNPREVSLGMAKLYTLPKVMGSSLALMALCVFAVALWPKGIAQPLQGTFYWPSQECINAAANEKPIAERRVCIYTPDRFWISQKALEQVLEPQGVAFDKVSGPAADLLSITVPGTTPVFIPLDSSEYMPESNFPDYLSLWDFIERFTTNRDTQLKISGWENPTFELNDVSFQLRDEAAHPVNRNEFYESYLWAVFYEGLAADLWQKYGSINVVQPEDFVYPNPPRITESDLVLQETSIHVGGKPNDVYGVLTFLSSQSKFATQLPEDADWKDATFWIQLGKVTEQGDIDFQFPRGPLTFAESFGYGGDLKTGNSILVRLAGGNRQSGGWYEVVLPESITVQ